MIRTFGLSCAAWALTSLAGTAAAQNTAVPPSTAGLPDGFLAEGPRPITVRFAAVKFLNQPERDEKGTLVLLTRTRLLFLPDGSTTPRKEFPQGSVLWVETREGPKHHWKVDATAKQFTGKVLAPDPVRLEAPPPFSPAEEARYLFFSLERLQNGLEDALRTNNERAIESLLADAKRAADYIQQRGLASKLGRLFADAAGYVSVQQTLAQRRRDTYAQALKAAQAFDRAKVASAQLRQQQALGGALTVLFGAAADDRDIVAAGLGGIVDANKRLLREQYELQLAKDSFAKEAQATFVAVHQEMARNREDRLKTLRDLAVALGLPAERPLEKTAAQFREKKDYASLARALTNLADEARRTSRGNPWLTVEACFVTAAVPGTSPAKKAEEVFALTRTCLAAGAAIPPGPFYDRDRVQLLWSAARLAVFAASLEHGPRAFADAYNPRASYALRVFALAEAYPIVDTNGDVREQRALALALTGRIDDALQKALEVEELRQASPTFHYLAARLYGAKKDADKALAHLEKAFQNGFADVKAVRANANLAPVHKNKRFAALTALSVDAWATLPAVAGGGISVDLKNRAAFALTGVKVTLNVATPQGPKVYTTSFARIGPGQSVYWPEAFDSAVAVLLSLETDQGQVQRLPMALRRTAPKGFGR